MNTSGCLEKEKGLPSVDAILSRLFGFPSNFTTYFIVPNKIFRPYSKFSFEEKK